jgi:hypothetical protein
LPANNANDSLFLEFFRVYSRDSWVTSFFDGWRWTQHSDPCYPQPARRGGQSVVLFYQQSTSNYQQTRSQPTRLPLQLRTSSFLRHSAFGFRHCSAIRVIRSLPAVAGNPWLSRIYFLYAGTSGRTGGTSPSSSSSTLSGIPPGVTRRAVTKIIRFRLMC